MEEAAAGNRSEWALPVVSYSRGNASEGDMWAVGHPVTQSGCLSDAERVQKVPHNVMLPLLPYHLKLKVRALSKLSYDRTALNLINDFTQ